MSTEIQLKDKINWIGVNNRQTALFEDLWPIPNDVTKQKKGSA